MPATALGYALVTTDPRSLAVGRAHYSMICAPDGGVLDDLIVYRLAEERFLVVANASNAAVVSDALAERLRRAAAAILDDRSLATALVAIQGPAAPGDPGAAHRRGPGGAALLRHRRGPRRRDPGARRPDRLHGRGRLRGLRRRGGAGRRLGRPAGGGRGRGARAGRARRPRHAAPRGRACRSTATSWTATRRPFEAGLGGSCKLDKAGDFVGRDALAKAADGRPAQDCSSASIVRGRGIARHGYPVFAGDRRDRRRHERHAVADARRADRDGLRRARATPRPVRCSTSEIRDPRVAAEVVPLPVLPAAR